MNARHLSWLKLFGLGAAGGILGTLGAHWAILLLRLRFGSVNPWLKGPHGPPFFDLALATALFYACVAAAAAPGRRLRGAGTAAGAAFLAIAVPMGLASWIFSWGEGPDETETLAWFYLVLSCYGLANLAGAAAPGWWASRRAAAGAALGCLAAGALHFLWRVLFPGESLIIPTLSFMPPKSAVLAGALWGSMTGLGAQIGESYGKGDR